MEDRRKFERIRASYYLQAFDGSSNSLLGHVYDISTKGMKIVGDIQLPSKTKLSVLIRLPEGGMLGDAITVDAETRWVKHNDGENVFETGIEFKGNAGAGVYTIKMLIADLINKAKTREEKRAEREARADSSE